MGFGKHKDYLSNQEESYRTKANLATGTEDIKTVTIETGMRCSIPVPAIAMFAHTRGEYKYLPARIDKVYQKHVLCTVIQDGEALYQTSVYQSEIRNPQMEGGR